MSQVRTIVRTTGALDEARTGAHADLLLGRGSTVLLCTDGPVEVLADLAARDRPA